MLRSQYILCNLTIVANRNIKKGFFLSGNSDFIY